MPGPKETESDVSDVSDIDMNLAQLSISFYDNASCQVSISSLFLSRLSSKRSCRQRLGSRA